MNRYLLAGCAAVALSFAAGSASAAFELKLGGDAYFEAGFVGQDQDTNTRALEFRNRFRLVITPTAKADNGLTYGARLRVRANAGTALADGDRAFIFAEGAFGRVEAGVVNGPSDQTYVGHPQDYKILGLYDQYRAYVNHGTHPGIAGGFAPGTESVQLMRSSGAGTKINYFSPRFSGFQLGLSYMPRTDSVLTDVNRNEYGAGAAGYAASFQDVYEVTANYTGEFNGVGVKLGAGYSGGSATNDGPAPAARYENLSSWQAGLQLSYAGFAVGGGYVWGGESGQQKGAAIFRDDYSSWHAGVQYTTGPWVVGASYQYTEDAGSTANADSRELNAYTLGVLYTVAPGLRTGLEYTYFDADNETGTNDDDGSVVMLRSVVNF